MTHHSESIIQWLFLAIVLMSAFLIGRALFAKKPMAAAAAAEGSASATVISTASPELKSVLDKIVEQTAKLESLSLSPAPAPAPATMVVPNNQEFESQLAALRNDLTAREAELAQLKTSAGANPGVQTVAGDVSELSNRVKELEAKLKEYEILEDDIADLSLFKEENGRLRAELEKLKVSGASVQPESVINPAPQTKVAEEAPAAASGDDLLQEFAQAVGEVAHATSTGAPLPNVPDTGDPMNDFESTIQMERQMAVASTGPEPAVEAPEVKPAEDLFAEFSADPTDAGLDTDKMLSEISALDGLKGEGNALEESMDLEKMVLEAKAATKP